MTDIMSRIRDAIRGASRSIDPDDLLDRMTAIREFLTAVDGQVPERHLVAAHTLVERVGTRLALSRDHTVVALAGTTGSGKSSLFNALARLAISPVGVRRPTTGVTHACVWGPIDGAIDLLDWLGVLPRNRFVRESPLDGDDEAGLHGLVLLDLPDFDSVDRSHRTEVDRLLGLVDLVVWVVDPQKYADLVVHQGYLREFQRHRDVTVVVLNQLDVLPAAEAPRVLADLRRLLDADGLTGVPLLGTSAVDPADIAPLRATLKEAVTRRQAALQRLAGEIEAVTEQLAGLVGPTAPGGVPDRSTVDGLISALAEATGVPVVAQATEEAYRHRAGLATGWPLVRRLRRRRPDPLRRLHLDPHPEPAKTVPDDQAAVPVATTSLPAPTAAQRAAVGLAVRRTAERAGASLPEPWPDAVAAAARSRLGRLPDALDHAVAETDLGLAREPRWWRLVGAVQWLVTVAAVAGLGWLLAGWVLRLLGLSVPTYPLVGAVPVPTLLLLGGLASGLLLTAVTRPVIGWAARRAGQRAEKRLHASVADVGHRYVLDPIGAVLRSYDAAHAALTRARSGRAAAPGSAGAGRSAPD